MCALSAHEQSRAVAEVRNPQHKHDEMIHGPDFNNFMSHKPWQQVCPSRQQFLVSSVNTFSVFAAFLYLLRISVVFLYLLLAFVFAMRFLNAAHFSIGCAFLDLQCVF